MITESCRIALYEEPGRRWSFPDVPRQYLRLYDVFTCSMLSSGEFVFSITSRISCPALNNNARKEWMP